MPANEYVKEYLQYGGQAIIEGVMMRSPHYFSVACRAPNGEIVVKTEPLEKTWIGRQKWLKYPFLRGSLALLDAVGLGSRAMKFASKIQLEEKYSADGSPATTGDKSVNQDGETLVTSSDKIQNGAIGATLVVGMGFGLFLFVFLPNWLAEHYAPAAWSGGMAKNIITECIKVIFFLGYLGGLGFMPDVRRVFCYHGAEHKAINTLESDRELNIENCKLQTRLHPRCGTSFAIIVLILSFVIFTFVPRYPFGPGLPTFVNVFVRFGVEIIVLPIISGISYELIRLAGKFRSAAIVNILFKPGLMSQYLTTREPDAEQIEVALVALRGVVEAERADREPVSKLDKEVAQLID